MPEEMKPENQKATNRWPALHYRLYIGALFLIISGLTLLAFTSSWLKIAEHFPVFFIAIGLLSLITVVIYREMFERPTLYAKPKEVINIQEQIIDAIIRRAKWVAAIAAVVAFIGVDGYIRATFGPQLAQIEPAVALIKTAEDDLKKINDYFKQIQGQKAEIERLHHDADSLRQDMERSRQDSENLQRALTTQVIYFNKRIKLLDSSLNAFPQTNATVKKILEKAEEIDRIYAEFRENQLYEVTIHYSDKDSSVANKIHFILEERGFKIYLDERKESEMSPFAGFEETLFYYTIGDENKAGSIEQLLKSQGIKIGLHRTLDPQRPKKYDLWP